MLIYSLLTDYIYCMTKYWTWSHIQITQREEKEHALSCAPSARVSLPVSAFGSRHQHGPRMASRASRNDDGGLAIVRVKPMGAGGGGVEASGAGLADGEGALRYDDSVDGVNVLLASSKKNFNYPAHVIPPSIDNEALYGQFLPHRIEGFLSGINVNVMCYGQTGTGKTHTIFGTPGLMECAGRGDFGISVHRDYGIFPRAVIETYHRVKALGDDYVLTCSALELSMLGNKCMIDAGRSKAATQGLCAGEAFGVCLDRAAKPPRMYGMEEIVLDTDEDVLRVFAAIATRNTAGTGMNDSSSRTHCFAFLRLYARVDGGDKVRRTRFQFVDLAGSERLSEASGTTDYRENMQALTGMMTNYSLTMLSQAIRAFVEQRTRERRKKLKPKPFSFRAYLFDLIQLLSESMTGAALTAVIVCLSQSPANASQTAFALQFGSSFSKLSVRERHVNPESIASLIKKAQRQKAEAERVLATTTAPKYISMRKAQKMDAEQFLHVMSRLGAECSGAASAGGGGGGGRARRAGGGGDSTPRHKSRK